MKGLPNAAKTSLEKAHDAALLAVEIYNKPAVKFKSGGYISLMIIAWTALFHSIFFRRKIKPFYKGENGRYLKREGDYSYWNLGDCLKQFYQSDTENPIRKNLEFFIPLRNKIEHKSLPEIDSDIFGECQAMLLNFDELIGCQFGEKYCLRESLSFSLQLFPSSQSLSQAVKHNPATKPIVDFINRYRSSISTEIFESNRYTFKAFLIQVANHRSTEALPIQFVHYDGLTQEQKEEFGKFVAMVKFKEVGVTNADKFKSGDVVKLVQEALGNPMVARQNKQINKFNSDTHTRCWKKYAARPSNKSQAPEQTDTRYCVYDKAHNDYLYTKAWIDLLIVKMKVDEEYSSLYQK
ncbi:MAG: DUF3644 domain-containing protein [Bacteroidota bacterium]